jgi:hypothetical protein
MANNKVSRRWWLLSALGGLLGLVWARLRGASPPEDLPPTPWDDAAPGSDRTFVYDGQARSATVVVAEPGGRIRHFERDAAGDGWVLVADEQFRPVVVGRPSQVR